MSDKSDKTEPLVNPCKPIAPKDTPSPLHERKSNSMPKYEGPPPPEKKK
jgi:hypothetical protein